MGKKRIPTELVPAEIDDAAYGVSWRMSPICWNRPAMPLPALSIQS